MLPSIIYRGKRSEVIGVYRRTALIYNPAAGGLAGARRKQLDEAVRVLQNSGYEPYLAATTGPRTAGDMARRSVDSGAELVLVAGGDGTINEAAEGIAGTNIPFGILPAGTANVLANEMGMPRKMACAAEALPSYVARRISTGRIATSNEARRFLLMAGIGLDAHVVYRISAPLKARLGKAAYWISAFGMVGRPLPEFNVTVDGTAHRCSFALVSKVRNYGGDLNIARDTSLLDDRFEVVLFAGSRASRYLKYFAGVAANRLKDMSGVTIIRARSVEACCDESSRVYAQIDGEYAGRLPVKLDIVPDALTMLMPTQYIAAFNGTGHA